MSVHVFGTLLTVRAVAHNNRGEVEGGNINTLQKIIRNEDLHSTVSGEAIRYAIRELWYQRFPKEINRPIPQTLSLSKAEATKARAWKDPKFPKKNEETYLDNDVLGYMSPSADTVFRRGVLEVSRAVSTTPWPGTVTNHFASAGSQPSNNADPRPYTTEVHDTRYQFSFAMTPESICGDAKKRTQQTLEAIRDLRRVGGSHACNLYDFAPEAIILRVTDDPAPRIMFCFDENDRGELSLRKLIRRMQGDEPDVPPTEVIIGAAIDGITGEEELKKLGATVYPGVKAAFSEAIKRISKTL